MDALLFHPKPVHVPMALGLLTPLIAGLAARGYRNRQAGGGLVYRPAGPDHEDLIRRLADASRNY